MEQFNSKNILDEGFKVAFEKAEVLPSPRVWENIEKNLGSGGAATKRTGLIILQIAAAIAFVFASSVALLNYYKSSGPVYDLQESNIPIQEKNTVPPVLLSDGENSTKEIETENKSNVPVFSSQSKSENLQAVTGITPETDEYTPGYGSAVVSIPIRKRQLSAQYYKVDFSLDMTPFWIKKQDNTIKSDLWAKAGFGSGNSRISDGGIALIPGASADAAALEGNFNSDYQGNVTIDFAGNAYSMGFGIGKNAGNKWMVETGLSYVVSRFKATSNSIEQSNGKFYPVYYISNFNGDILPTPEYTFNNTLKYISVPLNVGYKIIDKKVGWIVNAGFATNFLVRQSISSEQYDSFNIKSETSPFRPVTGSLLLGTELFVNLGAYYQLSFAPKYNVGIMDITKPEAGLYLRPSYWNIGLNLRYMIK